MKKFFTLILIFGLTIQMFATNNKKDIIDKQLQVWFIHEYRYKYRKEINRDDGKLKMFYQRYKEEKITARVPFLLNIFLPFGVGSFVQGDYMTAFPVLGCNLLGLALCITGAIIDSNGIYARHKPVLIGTGAILFLSSYFTSLYMPHRFAYVYNDTLKKTLFEEITGFETSFNIGINGFQLSFKKSY